MATSAMDGSVIEAPVIEAPVIEAPAIEAPAIEALAIEASGMGVSGMGASANEAGAMGGEPASDPTGGLPFHSHKKRKTEDPSKEKGVEYSASADFQSKWLDFKKAASIYNNFLLESPVKKLNAFNKEATKQVTKLQNQVKDFENLVSCLKKKARTDKAEILELKRQLDQAKPDDNLAKQLEESKKELDKLKQKLRNLVE